MTGPNETEVKISIDRPTRLDELVRSGDFHEVLSRRLEINTLYDTPENRLRQSGMLLRLREVGGQCIITWKGVSIPGPHKSRPEVETSIGSAEKLSKIFQELGFVPTFRYEKFRTEFKSSSDAPGVVTFDETPIGNFLELEGPSEWIDSTAERLGFTRRDYILESYGRLYIADCQRRGLEPGNMIFPSER